MQLEFTHSGAMTGQVHHQDHHRHGDDTIDDGAPKQCFNRFNWSEVEVCADERRHRDGPVEDFRPIGFVG